MEDNQKKYVISIPSQDFTEEWTQDMLDQKKDKLIQKYPDARIEEEMDMAADEQYGDNLSYGITLPDGTTERWTGAMMNEKGAKLRKKYPDARISKLAFWSDNQIPQDQQEAQSFDIGNANAQLQQQTGMPAPEAPRAYAPSPMNEEAADEYRAEAEEQRIAEQEYLDSLPEDQREYIELMTSAANISERLGTYRERLDAEDSDKGALRRLRSNDEDALNKVYEGLNNNTYYKRQLARQTEDIEVLKDRIAVNAPDILADYPAIKGDPYASRGPEGDMKAANLEAAGRFAEDARKAISAPLRYDDSKGLANYAKGAGSVLSDPDFWNMGITDVQDKAQLRAVLQKINDAYGSADDIDSKIDQGNLDGILDLDEQYLLQSYLQMQDARSARYHDTSRGYKAGAGSAESAGFMLEMALTSGLGGAVKSGVTKGLGKWMLKGTQKIGTATKAGKIAKATSREAAKLVAGQTGNVLSAAARMPFMPSSYGAIAEQGTVVGDDGQLVSLGEAIKEGTLDNLTEVVTEGMGPATMAAISNTVGAAGLGTLLKKISRTRVGEFARKVANSPAYETMKKMGYDGLGEELLEEFDAAVIDQVRGNPEAIRDFVQTDNLLTTVLSFAPMTIMGGAVSTGQKMYAGNRLEKTAQTLRDKLIDAGYTQKQADYFIDVTRNSTPREISMVLTPVINQFAEGNMAGAAAGMPTSGDLFNAVKEYGKAVVRYQTFDGIYQQQEENQRTEVKNSILDKTGDNFWVDHDNGSRPTVETGTLADGTEVYVVSSADENGVAAAITPEGKKMFVNAAMLPEGTQIRSLDEYLSEQVMSKKLTAEQKRIEEETAARTQQVREQAQPGAQINLGTVEAPITGTVIQQTPDGVMVQTEAGVSRVSWEEAANAMNIGATPLTDEQIELKEMAELEAADAERDAAMAETEEETVDAVEETENAEQEEVVSEPLPTKADGSVDQTALWNQSPERWAEWNDEQRQDGGANSLNYINGAIVKEEAKLQELGAAYDAESDFDARAAIEQEISSAEERLGALNALQQKYVPAKQAQEEAAPAEEVPAVEQKAENEAETQPAEVSEDEARTNEIRQTLYDLYNDDSLSEAEIEQYVEANVKGSQEDLDKHMKKVPQMGRDMAKYKEAKAKHEAKTEELRKQRDFWREAQTYVTIPEVAEADMEPQNALEFAARELSSRSGIKLQPESFKRHTGYGSEASKFLSVQRSKAKGGMTLEEAGERLMELDRENNTGFFDQNDPNAGLNAILDVIQSSATSGDLGSYIRSAREQAARQEVAAARDAMMAEMGQPAEAAPASAVQEEIAPQPETEFVSTLEEDMPEFQKTAIDTARQAVNVNPTEAQKEAGNYRMGHVKIDGFDVSIENPKGSVRKGKDADGNEWENTINNDYGYIRGTQGVDGDHIDVFLSDNPSEGKVYVIDQIDPETGEFDEHKVMYGFNSAEEAQAAYLSNYSPGWKGLGTISEVSKEGFKSWVDSSRRKTKPFSEYKAVKAEAERAAQEQARDMEATRQAVEFFTPEQELQRIAAEEGLSSSLEEDMPEDIWEGASRQVTNAMTSAEDLEEADSSYQQRLAEVDTRMAAARSDEERRAATDERAAVLQQYMDEISSEDKATVLTPYNYAETMRADGCSEQSIREVEDAVNDPLVILGGFMCNGRIYVMTDVADINRARRAYVHERQHIRTRNDKALIDRVLKAIPDRRTLLMFVELLSGTDDYRGYTNEVLADEIISFAMERAYSAEDFVSSLQYSGIYSQELLNIINDIINEQREDSSLSKARRREGLYSHERRRAQGAGRQNGGAQRAGSSEVAQQGSRSAEGSSERTVSKQVTAVPSSEVTAPRNGEATLIEDKDGRILAETNGDGGVRFSMRTYREGGREYLENWLASEPDMTQEEKDFILKVLDKQYEIAKSLGKKYPAFGAWSEAEVQKDEDGQALMSVIKSNGDYALNLDFSLICKKRRPLNALLDRMIKDKILDKSILQEGEIAKINAVIQKYGFEVACALCFVDAKRYRTVSVAKTFAGMYNQLVESLIPEGSSLRATEFNYAGYPHIAKLNEAVAAKDDLANANDSELDWSYVDEVLASAKGRGLTTEQKIAKLLKANPNARRLTSSSDFITNKGFEAVKKGNPALLKLYNAKKGTGGPKASFGDVQYLNDILKSKAFNPQKAYAVGGVRIQSFSDYMGHMFFDYMQMMAELAAKKLPAHAYTKEWLFAEIFGMTGLKINLSLVPAVAEGGIAPGLDAEGNYVWAVPYTDAEGNEIQGQTFPPERAFALTQDPRYSANVTPIAVGISDEHIRKLLDDDRIHQVIPYHKSSLSPIVAEMTHIDSFVDYTNVQTDKLESSEENDALTPKQKAKKLSKMHFDFYKSLAETKDTKATAQAYLEHCRQHGIVPKFPQFADHENYYKLLVDFNTYDFVTGEYAPQGPVTMTFPDNVADLVEQGVSENEELTSALQTSVDDMAKEVYSVLGVDGLRKQVTPAQDAAYLAAVEAGDMETAQRMVDAAAEAAGYTIRGEHGRVSKFTIFDRNKANPEGNWGQGFYFSNNEEDVEENYATVDGPDIEAKIEREVEKRVGIAEMNEEFNEDGEVDEFAIREEVEKEFITSEPNIVHAAIKMDKPFVVGHGMVVSDEAGNTSYDMQETYLDVEYEYDEDGEIDYDSEPTGTLIDLIDALNEEISNYDWANFNANEILQDTYDGMTASQFESAARELLNSHIDELVNDRGDVMTSEILRAAIERAGFDGIIDNTVNQKFGDGRRYGTAMAGIDSETRHYISFDSSNIKDTDPVTYDDAGNVIPLSQRFNPDRSDIRFQKIGITPEVREEMDRISANAIMDGTYMQAPNGKPTNLTADQWALVRTEGFKKWFGDWEKAARIQKLRDSKPVTMKGDEYEGKYELNRDSAQRFILDELRDTYTIADTNERIRIVKKGAKKVTSHSMGNDAHMKSIAIIPEIIRSAIFITEMPADKADAQYDSYRYYVCGLDYAGESYTVKMTVGVKNGDYYYDHTLTDIEKGKLLDMIESQQGVVREGFTPTGNESDPSYALSDVKDRKLISILQNNSSKVVDENGEPKVVYHQTNAKIYVNRETGQNWDDLNWREKMEWDERDDWEDFWEEQDFNTFSRLNARITNEFDGFFFAPEYDEYHEYGDRTIAAFVNIKNPASRQDYNIDSTYNEAGRNERIRLQEAGFDGVIRMEGDEVDEYIAFEPSQIKSATDNTGEFSAENPDIRFQLRRKPAPEKTGVGYKVFYLKDGKLYPPMVANQGGIDTPVGVWLDAEEGTRAGVSKTGRPQVKQGGKGTQGGSGTLAYRPGWHLGEIPYAIQFNRKDENGDRTLFPADFVWAEVEYADDVDYQEEAMSYGMNANGKFQHSLAGLPKLPVDGSYRYRTNPNPETDPWIITGAMKVNRLLTPSEVDRMVADAGRTPQKRQEGAVTDEQIEALNDSLGLTDKPSDIRFSKTGTPTDKVVNDGLRLSQDESARLAGNIFEALPESARESIVEETFRNGFDMKSAIFQMSARLAEKEELTDEEADMAKAIAQQVEDAVIAGGVSMTRPLTTPEALWMLYRHINDSSDIIGAAREAVVADNLGFSPAAQAANERNDDYIRFRKGGDAAANAKASLYNRGAVNVWTRLKESFTDMNASVEELVRAIEKKTGKKAEGFENILMALNQQSSKGLASMEKYERRFLNPMLDEIRRIMTDAKKSYDDIVRYVILKHGLERNELFAKRDAREYYNGMYGKVADRMKTQSHAQRVVALSEAKKAVAAIDAEMATATGRRLERLKEQREQAMYDLTVAELVLRGDEKQNEADLKARMDDIDAGTDAKYKEFRDKDYSGITSMFYDQLDVRRENYYTEEEYQAALMDAKQDKYKTLADVEAAAAKEVEDFESAADTARLWETINAATKETLRQQYQANMISKDQYDSLREMFKFYVPLRGFKDNTAEDMYTYYRKPNSTGWVKPILAAEGRKTEAESPFGWIANMAGSAIASNVKNEAKLALFYFVSNRPDNGIATITKTWFRFSHTDPVTGRKVYVPAYPPFTEDLSSDAAKASYEKWQQDMKELQKKGEAYESGQRLNLGNAVVNIEDKNKPEHVVNVKIGGKDYSIIINGNPRAAQAINGDLNIESSADYGEVFGPVLRWMSSVNTSYNPEFWITNMMRDMAFTWMAVSTKESPAYRRKFAENYRKALKVVMYAARNENGRLGSSYLEKMYQEFVDNGGVTGYTQIKDNETWEKEIDKYLSSNDPESRRNGWMMRRTRDFFHGAHRFGESLEQVSRFAAFLTSREMGKSMPEAVSDAKEITVNFNRKGSGKWISFEEAKTLTDRNGQRLNKLEQWAAVGFSAIAPLGRRFIMFFNAAIQGLNATYRLWKANPKRFAGWAAGYTALGILNAVLHAFLDDDDDYLDMPEYERRESLMVGWNGVYLKWAMPQEARAFYALGDLAVESIMGRNAHESILGEALSTVSGVLPLNPAEGWKAAVPSVLMPAVEILVNKDYKGSPIYNKQIYKDEAEVERSPKWASAYEDTGKLYIRLAQGLNFITGGDEDDAGFVNIQPEKVEHIVESAFGGTLRTANKTINMFTAIADEDTPVRYSQLPFVGRVLAINDERFTNAYVSEVFDFYRGEALHAKTKKSKYEKADDQAALEELKKTDEYKIYEIYEKYNDTEFKALDKAMKLARDSEERRNVRKRQDAARKRMIKEISNL